LRQPLNVIFYPQEAIGCPFAVVFVGKLFAEALAVVAPVDRVVFDLAKFVKDEDLVALCLDLDYLAAFVVLLVPVLLHLLMVVAAVFSGYLFAVRPVSAGWELNG
jgi:hypothetical protein